MINQTSSSHRDLALLTPVQMGEADRAAEAAGVRGSAMMESAGAAVAVAVGERWPMRPVTVLCGPGNNGGDGFVVARHLDAAGWPVKVALLGERERLEGDAALAANLWTGDLAPFTPESLDGAGLSRALDGEAAILVEALKSRRIPICAVDLPSGLDGASGMVRGSAASADLTVTFFRKTPGHLLYPGRGLCGQVVVADIGTSVSVLEAMAPNIWENDPDLGSAAIRGPSPKATNIRAASCWSSAERRLQALVE